MLPKIVHHCWSYHGYDTHDDENNKLTKNLGNLIKKEIIKVTIY